VLLITLTPFSVQSQGCAGAPPPRLEEGMQAQVITAGGSNLRSVPGSGNTLLDIIPINTVLRIRRGPDCEQGYTWWQVDYRDNRGWIAEGTTENYWLRPYEPLVAKADTVEITVPPELADSVQPRYLPRHVGLRLQGYPVTHPIFEPVVRAFPQPPDYAYEDVQQVRSALFEGADFDPPGSGHSGFVNFEDGSGLRYTEVFIDPGNEAIPPAVLYNFRGFSVNGHYLSATFPVQAEGLPLDYDPPLEADADPAEYEADYQQRTEAVLRSTPPQAFTPSLEMLDRVMQSITTSAPPVPLDERAQTFEYSDDAGTFQFEYVPELATDVNRAMVRAMDARPRHLRLILQGYALDNLPPDNLPTLRIYETDNLDSDWLVSLQLLLSQQPRNPSRIPVLHTDDAPSGRAQVSYFRFQNGEGLRALLRYDDRPTWLYVYQGLSDDSRYYVSMLLPVVLAEDVSPLDAPPEAFSPRLTWLDNLAESLRLSAPDETNR
jgi:hypothetical protein